MPLPIEFSDIIGKIRDDIRDLITKVASQPAIVVDQTAVIAATESIVITQDQDSGWLPLSGPALTVTTSSGKINVTLSGRVRVDPANTNSRGPASWQILNAAGAQVVGPDEFRGLLAQYKGSGMGIETQSAFVYVHTGLPPGSYTVRALHRYWDGPGGIQGTYTADFTNRTLVVKGY